jgi:hypothetical protein
VIFECLLFVGFSATPLWYLILKHNRKLDGREVQVFLMGLCDME